MMKINWPLMRFPPINLYSAPIQQWDMKRFMTMSKGSKQRPRRVDDEEFEKNWEKVFGSKYKQTKKNNHNKRWYDNKESIE